MAGTSFPVNHPLAVKLWSKKLFYETLKTTWMYKFMGRSSNSLIQILDDTSKDAGDKITFGLRMLLNGRGVTGDATQEGNEEALVFFNDSIIIDQLRHAVRTSGKMSEQRVPYSLREESRSGLQDWWADRIDTWCFNQLAGNTGEADVAYTGMQAALAPDASHLIAGNMQDGENSLSATTTWSLKLKDIDRLVNKAKLLNPQIRPIRVDGGDYWVLFIHPNDTFQLRNDTGTNQWADIQKAAMQGGQITKNPLFTGALGMWNNVILHESTRVPRVPTNANFSRCIFAGAQAAAMAFGKNSGPNKMSWVEEKFDYQNQFGVSAGMIAGVKKCRFDGKDFATITLATYAPNV